VLNSLKGYYEVDSLYTNRVFTVYQAIPVSEDTL